MLRSFLRTGLALSAMLLTARAGAQTTLPYSTGFDDATQKAGWQLFKKGTSGTGKPYWVYSSFEPFSAPSYLNHDYPVGGIEVTDNWFVSPMFHLPSGGRIDSLRHSFHGFGVPHAGDTVAIYLLQGNADPSLASSMTILKDFRNADYVNDGNWYKNTGIVIPPASSHCYIAFRYRTIINWLDVRFDNLSISSKATAIDEVDHSRETITCFPNPASDIIYLRPDAGIREISIFDISGRELLRQPFSTSIAIGHLAPGTYLLRSLSYSGMIGSGILLKK